MILLLKSVSIVYDWVKFSVVLRNLVNNVLLQFMFSFFIGESKVWLEGILLLCDDCNQWTSQRSMEAISETGYAEIREERRITCTG